MNTVIVILFCLQIVVVVSAIFALVLVYSPIRRMLQPVVRLFEVIKASIAASSKLINQVRGAVTNILGNLARITMLFRRQSKSRKSRTFVSKLLTILITGKRIFGFIKLFKQRGRNRFWGMFRLLMLAGPIVVPILSSLKKLIRKPA
jgi:hypothetical protein